MSNRLNQPGKYIPMVALAVGCLLVLLGLSSLFKDGEMLDWSEPIAIGLDATANSRTVMKLDKDDNIHLVWKGQRDYDAEGGPFADIYYSKLSSQGKVLIPPLQVSNQSSRQDAMPSLAVDSKGNAHIVWYTSATISLWYSKIDPQGSIIIDTQVASIASLGTTFPILHIDKEDRLFLVLYTGLRGGYEVHVREMDTQGQTVKGDYIVTNKFEGVAEGGNSFLDGNGYLHLTYSRTSWEDHNENILFNSDIYYHRLTTDFLWFVDVNNQEIGPKPGDERTAMFTIDVTDYSLGETWFLEGLINPEQGPRSNSSGEIELATPESDYQKIGSWNSSDLLFFRHNTLRFDVTSLITGNGQYRVRWTSDDEEDGAEDRVRVLSSSLYTDPVIIPKTRINYSPDIFSYDSEVLADNDGKAFIFWSEYLPDKDSIKGKIHFSVVDNTGALLVNTSRISKSDEYRADSPRAVLIDDKILLVWDDHRSGLYYDELDIDSYELLGEKDFLPKPIGSGALEFSVTKNGKMIFAYGPYAGFEVGAINIYLVTQDVASDSPRINGILTFIGTSIIAISIIIRFLLRPSS